MRLLQCCIAFAFVCFALVTTAQAACKPTGNVLFQDTFDELASSWGTSDNYRAEGGRLLIEPPAGFSTWMLNTAALYDDVDVCAEMTVAPPVKKGSCGGIVFWADDIDNLYTFQVSPEGRAQAWRRQKGKWVNLTPFQSFAGIRTNANQVNELRVTTVGNKASLFVNGRLFKEVTGKPPDGGSKVGLIGCSGSDQAASIGFDNFIISGPGEAPAVATDDASLVSDATESACKPSGSVLFSDQFDELAPSWGAPDHYQVEGGKLVINPLAKFITAPLNDFSIYDNVDICVEMNEPPPVVQGNCGGIIFWAADYDNYYSLEVSTNGQASVWRRQKGQWLNQAVWENLSSVRKGADQVNVLRVSTSGNRARFFVNGKLFKELTGQPPAGGSKVGLLACSPTDASARVEFDNFSVSDPAKPAEVVKANPDLGKRVAVAGLKCESRKDALFEDHFDTLAPSWGTFENYKVDNGEFLITPPAGYNTSSLNTASLYDDIDLCVEMKPRAPVPEGACGAVNIWAEDIDNYYSFQVSTDGQASFWRRQRGKWLNQIAWQPADGINTGEGTNQLRVITKGRTAQLFINGKLFKQVQGIPPAQGQEIGLLACAAEKQAAAIAFDNLVVSPIGAPAADKVADNAGDKAADRDTKVADKGEAAAVDKPVDKPVAPVVVPHESVAAAPQGRRVALVMGIGSYKAVPALPNPPRDAAAIADELSTMGFEVTHVDNLDELQMRRALQDFEDKADGAAIALIYYAGHGMEVDGVNYLIPTDAQLARDTHIDDEAIPLSRVLSAVGGAQLRIVLLDACRNNPFIASMARADGSRAVSRGLARVEPDNSTVVVFSAKDGTTADDGNGQNSPFASALLANLKDPSLEINMLFRKVTAQVKKNTGGRQEPFVYASLGDTPVFLAAH